MNDCYDVLTQSAWPEGCSNEAEEARVAAGELLEAGAEAPIVLDTIEEALNRLALLVAVTGTPPDPAAPHVAQSVDLRWCSRYFCTTGK